MRTLADVDWAAWTPQQVATLLFVLEGERVLLIRKKRGLGAGKINGPGGRLDPGETPLQAALRETREELGITATGAAEGGTLSFQFVEPDGRPGLSIHVHVFTASGYAGVPTETAEAIPLWAPRDALPYDEMWADDRLWLPLLLEGRRFSGRFLFAGDTMLAHALDVAPAAGGD